MLTESVSRAIAQQNTLGHDMMIKRMLTNRWVRSTLHLVARTSHANRSHVAFSSNDSRSSL
jgi:hypothetical protein